MKKKEYTYQFANEFAEYLKNITTINDKNRVNILSRINSLLVEGYQPRRNPNYTNKISFVNGLQNCVDNIKKIVLKSKKEYHGIVLQTLAALLIIVQNEIENKSELGALRDIRSALMHYYSFIEEKLQKSTGGKKGGLTAEEAVSLKEDLANFYGIPTKWVCYTQKEVRENFKSRLHSQDRLYNHNLLFPITLIVKLFSRQQVAEKWTDEAIDNIDILISKSKKTIKFKEVSFFLISINTREIYVFQKGKINLFQVYTRTFKIIEETPTPITIRDDLQPLKSIAIDHVTSMQKLIQLHAQNNDVTTLKQMSDDFVNFVISEGIYCLKKSWRDSHPYANGLDILTSKTINDLANGFINYMKKHGIQYDDTQLLYDVKRLHTDRNNNDGGLELMDAFENSKKGGDLV